MTTTDRTDALAERLFGAALGALELCSVYLGTELGLYTLRAAHAALAPGGACSSSTNASPMPHRPGDQVERMMYGWSVTHACPPSWSKSRRPRWAPSCAPVDNEFFRLYRLHP